MSENTQGVVTPAMDIPETIFEKKEKKPGLFKKILNVPVKKMSDDVSEQIRKQEEVGTPLYKFLLGEAVGIAVDSAKVLVKTGMYVGAGLFWLETYARISSKKSEPAKPVVPSVELRIHDASEKAHDVDVMYNAEVVDVKCVGAFGEEFHKMTPEEVAASNDLAKTELEKFEEAQKPADEAVAE